ncbi:Epidermal growth factor receptor kinase substrate 8 [Thelohanellus kitauei]|uniref:Epidermal growth factor receptor kinase substrate 8 n=1 Tax=Thelohanellus kitauei TaxID=669202 RepID=A0A0C2MSP6_THEKT|nr:Epidermal growth factor receptor kinase substrate 8 [Thelohanellus kitauei]
MNMEEDLVKYYYNFPKMPDEMKYRVTHIYSVPKYGNSSFHLKNSLAILRNVTNICNIFPEDLIVTLDHMHLKIYDGNENRSADKICKFINKISDISVSFENNLALNDRDQNITDATNIVFDSLKLKNLTAKFSQQKNLNQKQKYMLRRLKGLRNEEINDVIQKIRHALNLIAVLRPFMQVPNAVDFLHKIFMYLVLFVHLYGVENASLVENPYFNQATLKMFSFALTAKEYAFLSNLGSYWCHSLHGSNNTDLADDTYSEKFFGSGVGFIFEIEHYPLPDDNDKKLLSFNDYRLAKCNYEKQDVSELTIYAGEIIIVKNGL